ncbi:MAG TPA: hypothetical protein VN634_12085 [Candidatus Limnocylindrales bacterium]|nr:hypothetical protein [Candidatus Limnocylindrales bacterium]
MNRRITFRIISTLSLIASLAGAGAVSAASVSCETFNECTVGTCLEDGTCEETPGNNGHSCQTLDACTVGKCLNGTCEASPADDGTPCEAFDLCAEQNGTCSGGECIAEKIPDGAPCRQDLLNPCFTGTCTTVFTVTFCSPEPKCDPAPDSCDFHCNIFTGECESTPTHICDTQCTTATCEPDEDSGYTCSNPVDRPDSTPCEDGSTCTVNDKCQAGDCIAGEPGGGQECGNGVVEDPEECDDGDTEFVNGEACDAECNLVPCGKPTNSTGELPKASDALFTLKVAVNSATCALSVCDVNSSGSVTASDALIVLKKAVSSPVTLNCPRGGGGA